MREDSGSPRIRINNLLHRLTGHGVAALGTVRLADAGKQEPQVVVDLRNRYQQWSGGLWETPFWSMEMAGDRPSM